MTDCTSEPWLSVASEVLRLLKRHPLMEPLRKAREPVLVTCHERALIAHGLPTGPTSYRFEAKLEAERWWEPRSGHWAHRLASRLAVEVRKQWDKQHE